MSQLVNFGRGNEVLLVILTGVQGAKPPENLEYSGENVLFPPIIKAEILTRAVKGLGPMGVGSNPISAIFL